MAIGEMFESKRTIITDRKTGRDYWKMTGWGDVHCTGTYFYFQAFSGDERYLVFASERDGGFELYRLEIETGQTVQLTDHAGRSRSRRFESLWPYHVHPDGRTLLYRDEDTFQAIDLSTLERREVTRLDGQPWTRIHGSPAVTADGKRLLFGYEHVNGHAGLATADVAGSPPQSVYLHPDSAEKLGHINGATARGVLGSFCVSPDGQDDPANPPARRARAWKINEDGSAAPLLIMPPGFRATHEQWGSDGRMYFHKKTVPTFAPVTIASIDADGRGYREHYRSQDRKLGHHGISRDCTKIVSDVQEPGENELVLIDLRSGRSEVLCWPDSSVNREFHQVSHVHPLFSPSASKVCFTSDVGGKAAVFVMPL